MTSLGLFLPSSEGFQSTDKLNVECLNAVAGARSISQVAGNPTAAIWGQIKGFSSQAWASVGSKENWDK